MISANDVRGTESPCEECPRGSKPATGCFCRKWMVWFRVMWADIRCKAGKGPKLKAVAEDGKMYYEEENHD